MARGSAGESALHRHLRVLDAFDTLHPFRTLTEVAREAGLPPSTAHRLLAELEQEGLVERTHDRRYRLGVRLWELAARTPGAIGLREVARPWLAAVHQRIRQHTQLGVRAAHDVLFIERMSAQGAVVNATLIGGRIPLHASASGLVLLAGASDAAIDAYGPSPYRAYTERTIRTPDELHRTVARVRRDSFAVTDGHIHPESRGIAVPVRGPDATVYAALGVVVPNDETPVAGALETLRVAAVGIEQALAQAYGPVIDSAAHPVAGVSRRSWEYIAALARAEESLLEVGEPSAIDQSLR